MFTGLVCRPSLQTDLTYERDPSPQIEHLGTVSAIELDAGGCTLTIANSAAILDDCHIGDSIAVNGACLTVTEFSKEENGGWFKVWLANETLERTDLGALYSLHSAD